MTTEEHLLVGRYRVGELIGQGGMSNVHEGFDTRLNRRVAIKFLKSSLASDPAFRTRFRQEAQAASRMAHPTIVRVYDAGEETTPSANGTKTITPFIVMEYVEGSLLKDIIADGPLDINEAIRITDGILTALEYSHNAGVVHRDIKPGNVMITPDGHVKVMDFGIARAISDGSATVAQTTSILGTASYFSPEQARGETVDTRTDLYSTGVVFFEMLTGRPPFSGDTAVSVAYQHVNESPELPSTLNPLVTSTLDAVVLHALTKNRADRYQTASDFRDDLENAAQGNVPEHALESPIFTGQQHDYEQTFNKIANDTTSRKQSRPPVIWMWTAVAVIGVILVSVLIWVFNLQRIEILPAVTREVPALTGLTYEAAQNLLLEIDLLPDQTHEANPTIPKGLVIRTEPGEGTKVNRETPIKVVISLGPPSTTVPDVLNQPLGNAQTELGNAKLTYGAISRENSPTIPTDVVMRSDPPAHSLANEGSTVNLTVSSGNVSLPDLRGQSLSAAIDILAGSALQLTGNAQPDNNCPAKPSSPVVNQSLPPGEVPQKSSVTLTYCSGQA